MTESEKPQSRDVMLAQDDDMPDGDTQGHRVAFQGDEPNLATAHDDEEDDTKGHWRVV